MPVAALFAVLLVGCGAEDRAMPAAAPPSGILLVTLDTTRADRIGAACALVIGSKERQEGIGELKNLATRDVQRVALEVESIIQALPGGAAKVRLRGLRNASDEALEQLVPLLGGAR